MATLTTSRHPGSLLKELDLGKVTGQLMKAAGRPETMFMHCMPSVHNASTDPGRRVHDQFQSDGAEVTDDVVESPAPIVFDQAENRLHTIKAVTTRAFGA
jgi:ornithine carbamoyltransferase